MIFEKVKSVATEGALLTLVGKISYDVASDEFSITDGLGFVGGGLLDCLDLME
jgi:hypothetical protein